MSKTQRLPPVLTRGLNRYELRLNRRLLAEFNEGFLASPMGSAKAQVGQTALGLAGYLRSEIESALGRIEDLRRRHGDFVRRISRAATRDETDRHVLAFAQELGASPAELEEDRKALKRFFGPDAVTDRYERMVNELERRITFALDRLGHAIEELILDANRSSRAAGVWASLELERVLGPLLAYEGDPRVKTAAFKTLARSLRALPPRERERAISANTLQYVYRSAMYSRQDTWMQCEALELLEHLSSTSLVKVLAERLRRPGKGDDIFVRRRAVAVLARNLERMPELRNVAGEVLQDPSPFVRQGLAEALGTVAPDLAWTWLPRLVLEDPRKEVRAQALLTLLSQLEHEGNEERCLELWREASVREEDPFVLRVICEVAARGARYLAEVGSTATGIWCRTVTARLEELHTSAREIPVRRRAALARERVWAAASPRVQVLLDLLAETLKELPQGETKPLPSQVFSSYPPELVGRALALLAQDDFGLEVERTLRGVRITRGPVFTFKVWRLLHEFRTPSPEKRQAFPHTIGRRYRGRVHAPSAILAELAETKVPGEPLFIAEEGGWRPYLPLLDHVLSSLWPRFGSSRVRIYTSEGLTVFEPPRSPLKRARAALELTMRFAKYAHLRNWRQQSQTPASSYLKALSQLGFTFRFTPYKAEEDFPPPTADPMVERFFPVALPFLGGGLLNELWEYFISLYENSLFELVVFTASACGLFAARHIYLNAMIHRVRNRIPLVIGGWGTRGKSGTERLKAALINALGWGMVSKTTGCEAMFLYAHPFGKLRELFLFRPYDKATIWEQSNLLRLADKLRCEVFLWECMALTPDYVEVLQRDWMRDDLSTITNTYPDHEDLQGPAGYNIPEVMTNFIPHRSILITTEDQMLPILRDAARAKETDLEAVTWLEAGLIPPDVLARFPYDEHPNNIALVLGLAKELGVERDFALKEMADRVVPDLGVLKTYPVARVLGRRLQFVNGMSANERHGCLGNWTRLGFDKQDPVAEPGVWISTVVNNRADRVPRSKVFAKILVEDISADCHFLIGTNLTGLQGYIRSAWEEHAPELKLWVEDGGMSPVQVLEATARRFRIPTEREHIAARFRAMLAVRECPPEVLPRLEAALDDPEALRRELERSGYEAYAEPILAHVRKWTERHREYRELLESVERTGAAGRETVEARFREVLWRWFHDKLVVVEDPYTSGEQLVKLIAETTPPGFLNRIMGMQNIKGTGLDFVYRWQAWDTCYKACTDLRSKEPARVEEGIKVLSTFQEYGLLSEEYVRETLNELKNAQGLQREGIKAELAAIESRFERAMAKVRERLEQTAVQGSRLEIVAKAIEGFLDAGDAVKRRRLANRIYADLAAGRIGYDRTALELQKLNKRQKGGWLVEQLKKVQARLARRLADILAELPVLKGRRSREP